MAGRAAKWFHNLFAGPTAPKPLTASQLYSGPQAFGTYRPEAASAGNAQLANLDQVARSGWTNTDRAAFQNAQTQANLGEQAQRGALQQDAAARGAMNAGTSFVAALAAQQGGANRANQAATDMASHGADRRLGASTAAAGLQQQQAQAADNFNQWASQMQANAVQGANASQWQGYQQQQANSDRWWDRLTGLAGSFM
jgi:hypothetical protein